MFYLRYDDIEGLFREAAENYQINADKAFDWDRVNRRIHEETGDERPKSNKNKTRRFIFWILLMVSIGLFSVNIWSIESGKKLFVQDMSAANKSKSNNKTINDNASISKKEISKSNTQMSSAVSNKNENALVKFNSNKTKKQSTTETQQNNFSAISSVTSNDNIIRNEITNADVNPIPISQEKILLNHQLHGIEKNIPNLINPSKNLSSSQSKKSNAKKNSSAKFYIGAFVAPDVTFVEFQKSNGIGATFGLTAGYQLNKNWSIESGISLDKKKYYTNGEYFNKNNIPVFYNGELLSINGSCNMIELPLNIRYKFSSGSNHNFTAAAGTSSYFMTKESYNYSMKEWGETVDGNFSNHPSSARLFTVINVSAGYEKKMNNLSLLIEPYYKAAVKGIGTGNLNMSSAGINIGIKKYFGKK